MKAVKLFRKETLQIPRYGDNNKDDHDHNEIEEKHLVIEQIFTASDTGSVVWDAGLILMDFLKNFRFMFTGQRILELGSGTGYVGIGSSLLGAEFVLLSDQEKQIPIIQRNIKRNIPHNDDMETKPVDVLPLDWDSQSDLELVIKRIQDVSNGGSSASSSMLEEKSSLDWIIGSDLVYGNGFRENLAHLLTNLLKIFPTATVLISHEKRQRCQLGKMYFVNSNVAIYLPMR